MRKQPKRKLTLHRETLQSLSGPLLRGLAGGTFERPRRDSIEIRCEIGPDRTDTCPIFTLQRPCPGVTREDSCYCPQSHVGIGVC